MEATGGGWYGGYTVESTTDEVLVEKGLDLETLPLPAITLRISSQADTRLGVVVEDHVPEVVSPGNVGFHADHGATDWRVFDDGRLCWVRTLDPDETVTTTYGVWLAEAEHVFEFFDPATIERVRSLSRGDRWSPRIGGRDRSKRSVDEAVAQVGEEPVAALRQAVAEVLGTAGRVDSADHAIQQARSDLPEPIEASSSIVRAGSVAVDPPVPAALHALDDPDAADERIFVGTLVRDGSVPTVAVSVSTAGEVLGRRVRDHDADRVGFEAVLATAHDPEHLATSLAERTVVQGVLVAMVEAATTDAPADTGSVNEFGFLKREVEPVSPDRIDPELDLGFDDGSVTDLESPTEDGAAGAEEAGLAPVEETSPVDGTPGDDVPPVDDSSADDSDVRTPDATTGEFDWTSPDSIADGSNGSVDPDPDEFGWTDHEPGDPIGDSDEAPTDRPDEAVRAVRAEISRLRDRIASLESIVDRLQDAADPEPETDDRDRLADGIDDPEAGHESAAE
jgi:hypothetical protein